MAKILKSDFYRMLRSKSLYICSLIGVFLMITSVALLKLIETIDGAQNIYNDINGFSYGLIVFTGGDVHILMAIFISIFVTSEFSHGTMKNTVSKGYSKVLIYLSKLVTTTVASYFMILVMFIATVIATTIVSGNLGSLSGYDIGVIFIELLLHIALVSVFVLIAMVVRNNGGSIAINIICIQMVFPQLFSLLDAIFDFKIQFTDYSLLNTMVMYVSNVQQPTGDIIRSIIIGLVYLVLTAGIGIIAFKKQDVK